MACGRSELELYVHLPFCVRKCRYCDFLSGPQYAKGPYLEALEREIASYGPAAEGFRVRSVFFGGGTPSLLTPQEWEELAGVIRAHYLIDADAEITAEANPGTLDREKLRCLKELGVNRLSLGLQSVRDEELRLLGRIHSFDDFLRTWDAVGEAGFTNRNVDLMQALPGQSLAECLESVRTIAELGPEHISAYSLIIEEGTPFYELYAGGEGLPSEDAEREMVHETAALLASYGYEHYEISNYARPGRECRHNLGYWTGVPYLGFGMGAASLFGGKRRSNCRAYERYVRLAGSREACEDVTEWDRKSQMEEMMFLGLRLVRGVSEETFARRFGVTMQEVYGPVIERFAGLGLLERREGRLRLTERGMDVSNAVMAEFLLEETDG